MDSDFEYTNLNWLFYYIILLGNFKVNVENLTMSKATKVYIYIYVIKKGIHKKNHLFLLR